jgi:hypothetical protein
MTCSKSRASPPGGRSKNLIWVRLAPNAIVATTAKGAVTLHGICGCSEGSDGGRRTVA